MIIFHVMIYFWFLLSNPSQILRSMQWSLSYGSLNLNTFLDSPDISGIIQGDDKPGKLREFEKLSKSQGNLREISTFVEKTWKTQEKFKICDIIVNENVFQVFSHFSQGKV